MAFTYRRLAGLLILAAAYGCPTSVKAPVVKLASDTITGVQIGQLVRLDASSSTDTQQRDLRTARTVR